jgi:acetyl-CoA carboxylase beta subunit
MRRAADPYRAARRYNVPYVKCPTCEKVAYTAAIRVHPDLCPRCGDLLPLRRTVVPVSRLRRLADREAGDKGGRAELLLDAA